MEQRRAREQTTSVATAMQQLTISNSVVLPPEMAKFRAAVRGSVQLASTCVPSGAVLVSMAGGEQASILRPIQFARVQHLRCLLRRVVTLTWNYTDLFGKCVPIRPLPAPTSSSLREASYHAITWAKWHVLLGALLESKSAFFVDADVMLLSNPFAVPRVARFAESESEQQRVRHDHSLLYQFEGAGSNPMNSGQVLTSAREHCEAVRAVLSDRPIEFERVVELEQVTAYRALWSRGVSMGRLGAEFGGNCWYGPEILPWCRLVTFHAHCTASLAEKLQRLQLVLRETQACPRASRLLSAVDSREDRPRALRRPGG